MLKSAIAMEVKVHLWWSSKENTHTSYTHKQNVDDDERNQLQTMKQKQKQL